MLDIWPQDSCSPSHLFLTESPNSECFNSPKLVWLVRPRPFLEFVLDLYIFSLFWHHSITCLTVPTLTYSDNVTSAPLWAAFLVTCGCSLEDCIAATCWGQYVSTRGYPMIRHLAGVIRSHKSIDILLIFVACSCLSPISPLKKMWAGLLFFEPHCFQMTHELVGRCKNNVFLLLLYVAVGQQHLALERWTQGQSVIQSGEMKSMTCHNILDESKL